MTSTKSNRPPTKCMLCEMGGEVSALHLKSACHFGAPVRVAYRKLDKKAAVIVISCYVPDCARHVSTFNVCAVADVPVHESNSCDLCNDNDAGVFRSLRSGRTREFTAPFRLEQRRIGDRLLLSIHCYVDECDRLFATLELAGAKQEDRKPEDQVTIPSSKVGN